MEKIRNTKVLGIIGNAVVILSVFLNAVVIEASILGFKQSLQYIQGDGKILLVLSIVNLIIIFAEKIAPESLKALANTKITAITSLIELIIIINFTIKGADLGITEYVTWHWGIGFYLMWIGAVLSMIFPLIYKDQSN